MRNNQSNNELSEQFPQRKLGAFTIVAILLVSLFYLGNSILDLLRTIKIF